MSAIETRFAQFFAAVNDGHRPHPWQSRLVEQVASTGEWPPAIAVPTGAGKTAVIDMHVFLVAERERQRAEAEHGRSLLSIARPPRRLVLVAPRRVLVDDQFERAHRLAQLLVERDELVVVESREALRRLCTALDEDDERSPLGVVQLRGGVRLDLTWRLDPARCQVVCATPQMWGSRLLMRGYRCSRQARNLESGLLGHDVVAVIDEAHLHGRLLDTATRVSNHDPLSTALHIVGMSATQAQREKAIALTEKDFEHEQLRRRVLAKKQVDLVEIDDWESKGAVAKAVADAARRLHVRGTVGVFVNTVKMALEVATLLDGEVEVMCGQMRPADVRLLREERPGLLDARGNADVDYLVSTQSLEVGVDLDLPAMVSMMASASALAQRVGRLNRSGGLDDSVFTIVAPAGLADADLIDIGKGFLPYEAEEIAAAAAWVAALEGDASPQRVSSTPLPAPPRTRVAAITSTELETAAITTDGLAADIDPAFYVDEPRDRDERLVQVAARGNLTLSPSVVRRALLAAPPRAHELAPLPLDGAALRAVLAAAPGSWVIRSDGGKLEADKIPTHGFQARPGDVIVVPDGSPICTGRIVGIEGRRRGEAIYDVMDRRPDGTPDRIVPLAVKEMAAPLEEDETLGSRASRVALAELLRDKGEHEIERRLRRERLADLDVVWCADEEHGEGLLVVSPGRSEGRLPRAAVTALPVTLDAHNAEVERRLAEIIDALDAGDIGVRRDQLIAAARWHDEGKRHPRFQQRMGGERDEPLAKPMPGYTPDRGDGWRHESISAAAAWLHCGGDPVPTVIAAAHHGHGRPLFDRDANAMLSDWPDCDQSLADAVRELFGPSGRYELERSKLGRGIGIHRLAYLEALLRCADMQVSREGK